MRQATTGRPSRTLLHLRHDNRSIHHVRLGACLVPSPGDGWDVWHSTDSPAQGTAPRFTSTSAAPPSRCVVTGPTLTEAYAEAARRARDHVDPAAPAVSAPTSAGTGRRSPLSTLEQPPPCRE